MQNKDTVITRLSVGRRNLEIPLIPDKILLNYLEVTGLNGLPYGMSVENNIVCLWVCNYDRFSMFFICLLVRLVPLSCTRMKKMISLQVVSKKLAMAGLSGTGFLTTSPGHIPGKRFSSFENVCPSSGGRERVSY